MSRLCSAVTGKYILGGRNNHVRTGRRDGTLHVVSAIEFRMAGPWLRAGRGRLGLWSLHAKSLCCHPKEQEEGGQITVAQPEVGQRQWGWSSRGRSAQRLCSWSNLATLAADWGSWPSLGGAGGQAALLLKTWQKFCSALKGSTAHHSRNLHFL